MAFVDTTGNDGMPTIYNVSAAVGAAAVTGSGGGEDAKYDPPYTITTPAPNRRDDVMLVQYLLKKVWQKHFIDLSMPPPPPPGEIKPDGFFGPITARWITQYQQFLRTQQRMIVDGRVDRARGIQSSISHTIYTIIQLNSMFRFVEPAAFADLSTDPDCPPELVGAILANTPVASG